MAMHHWPAHLQRFNIASCADPGGGPGGGQQVGRRLCPPVACGGVAGAGVAARSKPRKAGAGARGAGAWGATGRPDRNDNSYCMLILLDWASVTV